MFVDPNGENPLAVVAGALGVSIPVLLGMGSILIFLIVILSDQHLLLSMTQALSLLIDELISIRPNVVTSKTKIPSKLKNKDGKIKTPDTNSDEFTKKKSVYTHKKTKLTFEKSKDGHFGGPHWHASPPNAEPGDYYNISLDGNVLS